MLAAQLATNDYELEIIMWAKERRILQVSDVRSQYLKCIEETNELLLAQNKELAQDAIGDIFVTLVLTNYFFNVNGAPNPRSLNSIDDFDTMEGVDAEDCIIHILTNITALAPMILKDKQEMRLHYFARAVEWMVAYCDHEDLDFVECVSSAFETINKRTGKMIGGVFVKDE